MLRLRQPGIGSPGAPPGVQDSPGDRDSPGRPDPPGPAAARALFLEARRRRRRRRLTGLVAALVLAAGLTGSAAAWLPGAFDRVTGHAEVAAAALVGRSPGATGQARLSYRVVTAGLLQANGTQEITFSGHNRIMSFSRTDLGSGPSPTQRSSGAERIVNGKTYALFRVQGRPRWVVQPDPPYVNVKIIDPRKMLHVLMPYTPFRAVGSQVIGGLRLKVLRAVDPGALTRRDLLPVVYTSGQPVGSVELWVDSRAVVHRITLTFRAPDNGIAVRTPVSSAARQAYLRAQQAEARVIQAARQAGKPVGERRLLRANRRVDQAMLRAYPVRHGFQVTTTTMTFADIGQPVRITVPPHPVRDCAPARNC